MLKVAETAEPGDYPVRFTLLNAYDVRRHVVPAQAVDGNINIAGKFTDIVHWEKY